jgi:hypothetical protein
MASHERPLAPPPHQLLAGKQATELGLKEIPAPPATRVEVEDIDLTLAARVFGRERVGEARRDLIGIKAIDRRMRLHMPATALVYRSVDGDEVELSFALESRILDEHNRAFALAEGPKKARLLTELAKPNQIGTDLLSRRIMSLDRQMEGSPTPGKRPKLTLPSRSPPVSREFLRRLSVLDHPPLLKDAIGTSRQRVLIISPWITSQVVDGAMLKEIEEMLDRNVHFYLGFGLDDRPEQKPKPIPAQLEKLAAKYSNFKLQRLGNTHEKILIKDREYAVLTSFNWLSFKGDPTRPLRLERGVCISEAKIVDAEFATLVSRFEMSSRQQGRRGAGLEHKDGTRIP